MNRSIDEATIQEIRERTDIVEIIGTLVPLKRSGNNSFKGLCPFHQEKTPSFTVNSDHQHYHCFGCGKGGNVFNFIMEWEKVDFPEAVHLLAGRCGVVIPERSSYANSASNVNIDSRERLYQINGIFAKHYCELLQKQKVPAVYEYFLTRNIPEEFQTKFQIGATPDSWDYSLRYGLSKGFTEAELLAAGIVIYNEEKKRYYDRFRNRLIFAITNELGKVVGFSARTIEKEHTGAKYVNSPETAVFKKSHILYGLSLGRTAIRTENKVVLCEGQLDVIAMHRAGFPYAVAPQGTAFTDDQMRILQRYAKKVYVAFDGDEAGIKATFRALEMLLALDFEIRIVQFPDGDDPDGVLKNYGPAGIGGALEQAQEMLDFVCDSLRKKHDLNSPYGKSAALEEVLALIDKISNPVVRDDYLQKISQYFNISRDSVSEQINRNLRQNNNRFNSRRVAAKTPEAELNNNQAAEDAENNVLPPAVSHALEVLLHLLIQDEMCARTIAAELDAEFLEETNTPGRLLEELLGLTLNGEWTLTMEYINDFELKHPQCNLSKIMVESTVYSPQQKELALSECLETVKKFHLDKQRQEVLGKLRQAQNDEEKYALMNQLQEIMKRS